MQKLKHGKQPGLKNLNNNNNNNNSKHLIVSGRCQTAVLSALHKLTPLILTTRSQCRYYYHSHFADEEIEAQNVK